MLVQHRGGLWLARNLVVAGDATDNITELIAKRSRVRGGR